MPFVHLHVHSHYSLLDGLPKIPDLISYASELGMPAIALTDHGSLYGALEFYQAANKKGIKPIIGAELYLAQNALYLKRPKKDDTYYHILLLAKNETGYRNLIQLSTIGHLDGFYYKPRIDKTVLAKYSEGLICLSGCMKGELPQAILANDKQKARRIIEEYWDIFGKENFYIELQRHFPRTPQQQQQEKRINDGLIELARSFGIPLVATNDAHYLRPDDAEAQDILTCVQTGRVFNDENRMTLRDFDLSLASPSEMKKRFSDIPESIENTLRIAEECSLALTLGEWNFPHFPLPRGKTADDVLREQALQGLREKVGGTLTADQKKRLDYELDIIIKKKYPTYFLIVADFVNWARKQGIVTTTRGSAAGSLVSYAIGITTLNPLDYNLPFERFLNPERPKAPDIDVDLADDRRDDVIKYVVQKYGKKRVAKIATFGAMLARAAVRDVTRVLDLPYSFGDKIAKLIPFGSQGFPITIERAMELNPDLKQLYTNEPDVKRVIDLAQKIEGCARHVSVHAAGVVIAPSPLTDFVPLQREPRGGSDIITQYDMHGCEAAGLVKIDFLGIRNLSILGRAVKIVKKTKKIDVDLEKIPLEDKKTFSILAKGETMGIFQLSSSGMTRYLKELKPSSIHDIMAMVALYRPGPIESIPEYIRRKHGISPVTYLDDTLKPILEKSYGILVYQDDVLMIAITLAGYSWLEADALRKAMGKKIPEEMAAQKEKFISGCQRHGGLSLKKAKELWKLIEPFAAYGFNKAHAASYGRVAYQTAYMKAHFPAEYMTGVMTAESGNNEKIADAVRECKNMGIQVLPPDINASRADFTYISDREIRFGLSAIKNVGHDIIRSIISERKAHGPFPSLEDFLQRTAQTINKKTLESLIKSGALDSFGERHVMMHNIDRLLGFSRNHTKEKASKQTSLFSGLPDSSPSLSLSPAPSVPRKEILSWERELLGLYVTAHPLAGLEHAIPQFCVPIEKIHSTEKEGTVTIAGVITEVEHKRTRKGEAMAFASLEDLTGSIEILIFPDILRKFPSLWEIEHMLLVQGTITDKEGIPKLIAQSAAPLSEGNSSPPPPQQNENHAPEKNSQQPKAIQIFLSSLYNPQLNKTLKEILLQHQGPTKVQFCIKQSDVIKTIDTRFGITYNEHIRKKLNSVLGTHGTVNILS